MPDPVLYRSMIGARSPAILNIAQWTGLEKHGLSPGFVKHGLSP